MDKRWSSVIPFLLLSLALSEASTRPKKNVLFIFIDGKVQFDVWN
jgi:hypothetical protein